MGRKGERVFRNNYKGQWTKPRVRGSVEGSVDGSGVVLRCKCRQLYLNNKII